MKKLFILISLVFFLFGCISNTCHNNKKNKSEKIHCYKVHETDDTWLYYYIIITSNDCNYYAYLIH